MTVQVTLITSHKGVDLHAATAARVLRERLRGGDRLLALWRAEFHTYWCDEDRETARSGRPESSEGKGGEGAALVRLLATGRYYNPNKHHYGHFRLAPAGRPWYELADRVAARALPTGWPGQAEGSDLGSVGQGLYDRLLGGVPREAATAVDVCAFPLGEPGPLVSGVVWRLVLGPGEMPAATLAEELSVTREVRRGLLLNPHMQGWLMAAHSAGRRGAADRHESPGR